MKNKSYASCPRKTGLGLRPWDVFQRCPSWPPTLCVDWNRARPSSVLTAATLKENRGTWTIRREERYNLDPMRNIEVQLEVVGSFSMALDEKAAREKIAHIIDKKLNKRR